ncbi:hypothetical protein FFWV33_02240 [Flavobacterium faecale]|uniref:DUF4301 domain-containing protein n=1 Tax=Flavobacterium faecale TaxID=1355330 RepID=A0A2S1L9L7_9FLAO|nr:DUF4301 family protein [Flavobacterium faecale]AWG20431.1 hypothetical protein FFWV33_02240 [Flavobacterium faecale]
MEDSKIELADLGFSEADGKQLEARGISLENIEKQLDFFKHGIAKMNLVEPARLGKGIIDLSDADFENHALFFDANKTNLKLLKFVPASGAATRMFKFLNTFLNKFDVEKDSINAYVNRYMAYDIAIFIVGMDKFPFFDEVYAKLKEVYTDFDSLSRDKKNYYFIKMLMSPDYFDYANKPKGILPFHVYLNNIATPIEEHLYECGYYSSVNGFSNLHFTVSEDHKSSFEGIINTVKHLVERETQTSVDVTYSFQNKGTDTIAVDMHDEPFRDKDGQIVFRPGGHGALIDNLNQFDADMVFIKNIDNVILHNNENVALYKKALAGILLDVQQGVFGYLNQIENDELTEDQIPEVVAFFKEKLNRDMEANFYDFTFKSQLKSIKKALDRPIRVCGMVKNEGEPGGGPFWVRNEKNEISLQIVESTQVDLGSRKQSSILQEATHFNPVDLVCVIKNYKGEKFDLNQFVDHNSGFVVEKNVGGIPIKAYELPGLWNGAMAEWLTIFVQVPLITFNPVKTVNDLLKEAHQRS